MPKPQQTAGRRHLPLSAYAGRCAGQLLDSAWAWIANHRLHAQPQQRSVRFLQRQRTISHLARVLQPDGFPGAALDASDRVEVRDIYLASHLANPGGPEPARATTPL